MPNNARTARMAINSVKKTCRPLFGKYCATNAPAATPHSTPGTIARSTSISTACRLYCALALANDVNTITANDVPMAICWAY